MVDCLTLSREGEKIYFKLAGSVIGRGYLGDDLTQAAEEIDFYLGRLSVGSVRLTSSNGERGLPDQELLEIRRLVGEVRPGFDSY